MTLAFPERRVVDCRACGGTKPPDDPNAYAGVCEHCWRAFTGTLERTWKTGKRAQRKTTYITGRPTKTKFNEWLARQLFLSVGRMQRFGVAGRCEAVTGGTGQSGTGILLAPRQCGSHAMMMRDGRRVCNSHGTRADDVSYIDQPTISPYEILFRAIGDLASNDREFQSRLIAMADALCKSEAA